MLMTAKVGVSHVALIWVQFVETESCVASPGGYYKRRTDEDVKQDLLGISQRPRWVIEGVYGDLAEILLPRITCLFWLDLDPNFCAESVLKRGFENIPWMDTLCSGRINF